VNIIRYGGGKEERAKEAALPKGDATLDGQEVREHERLKAAVGVEPGAVDDGVAQVAGDVVALEKAPVAY
jgi:hypothetical protein